MFKTTFCLRMTIVGHENDWVMKTQSLVLIVLQNST